MPTPSIAGLRNHLPVLLIVPLVVIATTWPTFPRIFDADEFWLHVRHSDKWLRIWDAWHVERALAGQTDLYYTDSIFHPHGTSLAFYSIGIPHALLLSASKAVLPVDDAYNLLFLLTLCFNAFCGYALIKHLIKDRTVALFGAVVFAVATPFLFGQTVPDLTIIGTLPLTVYFLDRSIQENRRFLAGLAGICAGITAFIGVYVFAFILLTVAIFAAAKAFSLWRRRHFWRSLLLFAALCAAIGALRFYPMLANRAHLTLGLDTYQDKFRSNDLLEHFALTSNPLTGPVFRRALNAPPDYEQAGVRPEYKDAYLGYLNLFLIAFAFVKTPRRRLLLPWIVILVFFAIMRLGHYLTINEIEYTAVLLPKRFLTEWFPAIFGNIGFPEYYQIGVVMPLAVLSCYGLAALLRSKRATSQRLIALLCILVVCIEFYTPRRGEILEPEATAFVSWLQSEPDHQIKVIHLPLTDAPHSYYYYMQTLTGYPHANGTSSRLKQSARHYILGNSLLESWDNSLSVHCLPHNRQAFTTALDQLLADGFTHIVVHDWLYGDQFISHSFRNVPSAYLDSHVTVYRVGDLRQSCGTKLMPLPYFAAVADSPAIAPGRRTAILSLHPSERISAYLLSYLGSLFSDWSSFVHIYWESNQPVIQSAGNAYADMNAVASDNQLLYLVYDASATDPTALDAKAFRDEFNLCQRDANADGSVTELYVIREFSCALTNSSNPLQVQYDNGARLENMLAEVDQDQLDLQLMWSNLPDETHSVSVQIFDAAGEKALGQDAVIGHITLDRHRIDISSLPPGDYSVKLILYNFDTRITVAGTVIADGKRLERALDIASIHRA